MHGDANIVKVINDPRHPQHQDYVAQRQAMIDRWQIARAPHSAAHDCRGANQETTMVKKLKKRPHGRKRDRAERSGRARAARPRCSRSTRRSAPSCRTTRRAGRTRISSGNYVQVEGDKYDGKEYPIADGRYRVEGSDWLHSSKAAASSKAELASRRTTAART
jgi:hypothetical protein